MPAVAWISGGKLYAQLAPGEPTREIESPYAESVRTRAAKIARRNAWKSQGRGARFMMGLGGLAEDPFEQGAAAIPIMFTGLCRGRGPSRVVYSLMSGAVSGLFEYDLATNEEKRLFHGADAIVGDPAYQDDENVFACSVRGKGGFAHLAVMRGDGADLIDVTEGDAVDGAPSWIPGTRALVYQSSGIGRDAAGQIAGMSASAIHKLDVEKGAIETVLEEEDTDFTAPRVAADGTILAIRHAHVKVKPPSVGRILLDAILFPFRLIWAVIQYLNFFSARYTGKPLLTAGNAKQKRADARRMLVMGNLVDASREAEADEEAPAVDPSWQLVRRTLDGEIEVLARGVLSFDVCDDGTVVYCDGRSLFHLDKEGAKTTLAKSKQHIDELVVLRT